MTLKEKIVKGLACAGLAACLTGTGIGVYNIEQVKDSVAERLELSNGERVTIDMIDRFPDLRENYDNSLPYELVIPGVLLAGLGIVSGPYWRKKKNDK